MTAHVYKSGLRHLLADPKVYTEGRREDVQVIYAYDEGLRHVVWSRQKVSISANPSNWDNVDITITPPGVPADEYILLRNGAEIYRGTDLTHSDTLRLPESTYVYEVQANRAGSPTEYASAEATTPAYPALGFNATAGAWNSVSLSWNALNGSADNVILRRSGAQIYSGTGTSHTDSSRSASTTYNYTLEHLRSGVVLASEAASATTPVRPTQQKTVTLSPSSKGSYNGAGARRNTDGPFYSGYYSSNHGRQKSAFAFAIPSDVRNCVRIDKVEFSISNSHSYNGSGVTQYLAITHTQTVGSSWPGSTGHFGGRSTAKGGWYGGSSWVNITNDKEPTFNDTVAENFRSRGAWGICLIAPNDSQSYYSYWNNNAQLRITYTVYT